VTTDEVKKKIEAAFPGSKVAVSDLTGGGDHFRAEIVSPAFAGKSMIEQHRMVYAALGSDVGGPIHALTLVTRAG
jgi:stress-induced morphogen